MAAGLGALGARCELLPDGIRIEGGALHGGRIDSHGDHRVAMAFAVASVRATEPIEIDDADERGHLVSRISWRRRARSGLRIEATAPA